MSADPYTRMVSVLKVALPLLALGILSTLFLVSSRIEPGSNIPFASNDVDTRIRDQQVTKPLFSGVTSAGNEVTFSAQRVSTRQTGGNQAVDPVARLEFPSGQTISMIADLGDFNIVDDRAVMSGNVLIESTHGYRLRSDQLTSRLTGVDVFSPGEVRGTGPGGTLTAGSMRINTAQNEQNIQMLFIGGVKLVYNRKETEN